MDIIPVEKIEAFVQDALGADLDNVSEIHITGGLVTVVTTRQPITGVQTAARFLISKTEQDAEPEAPAPVPGPGPRQVP